MKKFSFWAAYVLSAAIFIAVAAVAVSGFRRAEAAREAEAARVLEESLRRAAVCCYAIEGRYPDSLEYLTGHYGVYIDGDAFIVDYAVFASNLMPDITVIGR